MSAARDLRALAEQMRDLAERVLRETAPERPAPAVDALYLSIAQYGERRAVSASTVKRWIARGMPVVRVHRLIRVRVADADRWVDGTT